MFSRSIELECLKRTNEQCSYVEIYFSKKILFHIIEDHHTRERERKRTQMLKKKILNISTTQLYPHGYDFLCNFDREIEQKKNKGEKKNKHCTDWANEKKTDLFIIIIIVVQLSVRDKPIVNLHCMNFSAQRRGSTCLDLYTH